MHTALAVTLAAHLVSAGCHAAAPLFRDVAAVKPYQQSAAVSYQMAPTTPAPAAESEHSASYRLPVRQAGATPAVRVYQGTDALAGSYWTTPNGNPFLANRRAAAQGFFARGRVAWPR